MKGKVAIITGPSKGIGKGIAERYALEGASVVLGSRSKDLIVAAAGEINALGGRALALELDVTDFKNVESVVSQTVAHFGRLDILVNNAGISMAHPSEKLAPEHWEQAIRTDLSGLFYGCQSAARQMMAQSEGGCIINITSMYGVCAAPMRAAYCSSKAGANMLTKVLACEWADRSIRVNAIAPGYIRTELVQGVIEKGMLPLGAIEKRTPQGRIGEVQDVIGLAVFMASDEAGYMTGRIVIVDGGWTAYGYI